MNTIQRWEQGETVAQSELLDALTMKHEAEIKDLRQMIEYLDLRIIDLERMLCV